MRLLGIDYGAKRVGIAYSDEEGVMAFPHSVLQNDRHLLEHIREICRSLGVKKIIMGDSRTFRGELNSIMRGVNRLKEKIEKEIGITVELEAEFLTSAEAARLPGGKGGVAGGAHSLDASAAALILKSHIDRAFGNIRE